MKIRAYWLLLVLITLTVSLFSSPPIDDFIGYWEGINISDLNGQKSDAFIFVNMQNNQPYSYYSGGFFNLPMNVHFENNVMFLSAELNGYTFNASYTTKEDILTGELLMSYPTGSSDLLRGTFNHLYSNQRKFAFDIDYFKQILPKKHMNLFFKATEKQFNLACDELIKKANLLTPAQIYLELKRILALVDDPHTDIYNFNNYRKEYYPFYFKKIGQDYYLFETIEDYSYLLGSKLISIGGNDKEKILKKLETIIPAQNETGVAVNVVDYFNSPLALAFCNVIDDNNEKFILKKDGKQFEIIPERISVNEYSQNAVQFNLQLSLSERRINENFFYEVFEDDDILYFQYNRCVDNTDPAKPIFSQISEEMLQVLKTKNIRKFIVDMRYNTGGDSHYGTKLAKQIQALNIDTKVYVIIGNSTFSSAILNTMDFKHYCNAITVGEPSQSSPWHYGETRYFILPNLGIKVFFSTKYFQHGSKESNRLEPDIEVYRTYDDFISGIDTVFEAIKSF